MLAAQMPEKPVQATITTSLGNTSLISLHSLSGMIGTESDLRFGSFSFRQFDTISAQLSVQTL
jgi:hypothetical protein